MEKAPQVAPLAFDEHHTIGANRVHDAAMHDDAGAVAINDQVAYLWDLHLHVAVALENDLNIIAADKVSTTGEHPAVAVGAAAGRLDANELTVQFPAAQQSAFDRQLLLGRQ